jgi:hypothetical protein
MTKKPILAAGLPLPSLSLSLLSLLLLLLLPLVGACSQKPTDKPATPETPGAAVSDPASPPAAGPGSPAQPITGGYVFGYNGAELVLGSLADDFMAAAGQPNQIFEAPSCAFEGIDKILYYPGFMVNTYPVDGKDYILAVVFADDSVTTAEGVYLGMSRTEVEGVYGSPATAEGNAASYAKDGMSLRFIYEDDVAVDITYYNDAAMETSLQ